MSVRWNVFRQSVGFRQNVRVPISVNHWSEYNWNPTSNRKFEAKLEGQCQFFHACEKRSISQSWHACLEIKIWLQEKIAILSEGSTPVIFISMVLNTDYTVRQIFALFNRRDRQSIRVHVLYTVREEYLAYYTICLWGGSNSKSLSNAFTSKVPSRPTVFQYSTTLRTQCSDNSCILLRWSWNTLPCGLLKTPEHILNFLFCNAKPSPTTSVSTCSLPMLNNLSDAMLWQSCISLRSCVRGAYERVRRRSREVGGLLERGLMSEGTYDREAYESCERGGILERGHIREEGLLEGRT